MGLRKGPSRIGQTRHHLTMSRCKPIEQGQAGFEAELLTGYTVRQGLKNGREARRSHAAKPDGEIIQARLCRRDLVEW